MDFALQLFVSLGPLCVCTYGKCGIGGALQCCRIISVDRNGLLFRWLIDRFKIYIYIRVKLTVGKISLKYSI